MSPFSQQSSISVCQMIGNQVACKHLENYQMQTTVRWCSASGKAGIRRPGNTEYRGGCRTNAQLSTAGGKELSIITLQQWWPTANRNKCLCSPELMKVFTRTWSLLYHTPLLAYHILEDYFIADKHLNISLVTVSCHMKLGWEDHTQTPAQEEHAQEVCKGRCPCCCVCTCSQGQPVHCHLPGRKGGRAAGRSP